MMFVFFFVACSQEYLHGGEKKAKAKPYFLVCLV